MSFRFSSFIYFASSNGTPGVLWDPSPWLQASRGQTSNLDLDTEMDTKSWPCCANHKNKYMESSWIIRVNICKTLSKPEFTFDSGNTYIHVIFQIPWHDHSVRADSTDLTRSGWWRLIGGTWDVLAEVYSCYSSNHFLTTDDEASAKYVAGILVYASISWMWYHHSGDSSTRFNMYRLSSSDSLDHGVCKHYLNFFTSAFWMILPQTAILWSSNILQYCTNMSQLSLGTTFLNHPGVKNL